MSRSLAWRGWLTLIALSIAAAFMLGEVALRIFMPQSRLWDTGAIWEPAQGLRWRNRPNVDTEVNTGERTARVITDAVRHRVGATPPKPGVIRILAVGDSMVQSLQVNYEQTMTALLERSLSDRLNRTVEVVNAGVGGYDPNQYLTTAKMEVAASRYDLVLVFVYVDNDIIARRVESYPADFSIVLPELRPLDDSVGRTMEVLGIRATTVLGTYSHLFIFLRNLGPYVQVLRQPSSNGTFHHLLSNAMRSNREMPDWRVTSEILKEVAAAGGDAGVPVVFVLLPSVQYVDPAWLATLERALQIDPADIDVAQPAERLGAEMRTWGDGLNDATPALRQAAEAGTKDLYGQIDRHFGPGGHQVMAKFLEPIVLNHLRTAATTHAAER